MGRVSKAGREKRERRIEIDFNCKERFCCYISSRTLSLLFLTMSILLLCKYWGFNKVIFWATHFLKETIVRDSYVS